MVTDSLTMTTQKAILKMSSFEEKIKAINDPIDKTKIRKTLGLVTKRYRKCLKCGNPTLF